MCRKLNINRSTLSELKAERTKTLSTNAISTIATYFDVSTDYLLGNVSEPFFYLDNKRTINELNSFESGNTVPDVNNDPELAEYLEELRTRPEMKMMFDLAKNATKEDVEKAVKIIEALFNKD